MNCNDCANNPMCAIEVLVNGDPDFEHVREGFHCSLHSDANLVNGERFVEFTDHNREPFTVRADLVERVHYKPPRVGWPSISVVVVHGREVTVLGEYDDVRDRVLGK